MTETGESSPFVTYPPPFLLRNGFLFLKRQKAGGRVHIRAERIHLSEIADAMCHQKGLLGCSTQSIIFLLFLHLATPPSRGVLEDSEIDGSEETNYL
ncbi:hypothetical protein TNIN_288931 [Trichonephila inaurata madagascariensis]|uniref:Uncharacterized protein n=1 Tax=Trichonephila inaurata madagascariensis TaxID=2747483 RepID=A0A8X6WWM0_9ARAC|nr:hypothetical protein TNIN_288931 [Trichonephila inaurata madagascariensis]